MHDEDFLRFLDSWRAGGMAASWNTGAECKASQSLEAGVVARVLHVAGTGRVRLQGACKAEAVPASALWLAVHLACHPDGSPTVGYTGAPPHQLVVLR